MLISDKDIVCGFVIALEINQRGSKPSKKSSHHSIERSEPEMVHLLKKYIFCKSHDLCLRLNALSVKGDLVITGFKEYIIKAIVNCEISFRPEH